MDKRISVPVRRADKSAPSEPVDEGRPPEAPEVERTSSSASGTDWRTLALRLRADMDNFRKRQRRLAEARVVSEKERLLRRFLELVDNVDRIIDHLSPDAPHLQSVKMMRDGMMKLLRDEGVEPITALNEPFDPAWHEAVAWVPAPPDQRVDMRVMDVEQKGYRLGDRLLRPAQVVVAKKA
jgi:molecular chaperone GrpE